MGKQPVRVPLGQKVRLADFDPDYLGGIKGKPQAVAELEENIAVLDDLGYRLYAENRRSLLLVLQGMDTSGKDGTIRHVMRGFNPQSCQITSFKQPSAEELAHDFLWRIGRAVPRRGFVGIFNRSHYEDVLVVRVHDLAPRSEWQTRYDRINAFERLLVEGGTTICQDLPAHQQEGAEKAAAIAAGRSAQAMEVLPARTSRNGLLEPVPAGL